MRFFAQNALGGIMKSTRFTLFRRRVGGVFDPFSSNLKKPKNLFYPLFLIFFKKVLDNTFICVIILKCIIIAFLLWGFSALFSERYVKGAQKTQM